MSLILVLVKATLYVFIEEDIFGFPHIFLDQFA